MKRKHRHILNIARALWFQASLPIEYWGECILAAGYLINRTPSALLQNKTPFEILYGHAHGYKHIQVMGCLAYAHNIDHKGEKFQSRSRRCVFFGYPYGKKGWRLFDLEREVVFTSRDVIFQETVFHFSTSVSPPLILNEEKILSTDPMMRVFDSDSDDDHSVVMATPHVSIPEASGSGTSTEQSNLVPTPAQPEPLTATAADNLTGPTGELLGRGHRTKKKNVKLHDYVTDAISSSCPSSSLVSLSPSPQQSSGTIYPISNYVSCDRFSPKHQQFLMALQTSVVPKTFQEAMQDPNWGNAVHKEYDSLQDLQTWRFEYLPPIRKLLDVSGCLQ